MDDTIQKAIEFHGHLCPGLMMGVRAARIALREIGPHSEGHDVVAIVETDLCPVDAIQSLTGCTFGKGNLIHRDYGKNAYTFVRRADGKAIRIITRSDGWPPDSPERQELSEKVQVGTATAAEERRARELQDERALAILALPEERLFDVRTARIELLARDRGLAAAPCAACGELTRVTHLHHVDGRMLCGACREPASIR